MPAYISRDPTECANNSSYKLGQQGNPSLAINFTPFNHVWQQYYLLTSEKTNCVSTIFMESYVLVQQAY